MFEEWLDVHTSLTATVGNFVATFKPASGTNVAQNLLEYYFERIKSRESKESNRRIRIQAYSMYLLDLKEAWKTNGSIPNKAETIEKHIANLKASSVPVPSFIQQEESILDHE